MREKINKISDSELEILKVLWGVDKEITIREIKELVKKEKNWDPSTIKTLVRRLTQKEVVVATKKDVFYYKAVISKDQYSNYSTKSLINKLFDGSVKNLIANLVNTDELTNEDIEELQALFKVEDSDNV